MTKDNLDDIAQTLRSIEAILLVQAMIEVEKMEDKGFKTILKAEGISSLKPLIYDLMLRRYKDITPADL